MCKAVSEERKGKGMVRLGKTDVQVSEIIQGTWVMGKDYWGGAEDRESVEAIHCALEHGIQTFDTAYIYGKGHAEELLGHALKGKRQDCTVITKLWKTDMARQRVQPALEEAMKRLETDYIDVFFIHYPVEEVPIGETMTELMRLKEEGRIGAVGVSNFSLKQMEEAMRYGRIDVIQPCYSLLWRFIDADILPFVIKNQIAVIPYSPLGQGILTGSMELGHTFREGDSRKNTPLFAPENFGRALQVTERVKEVAARYGRTPAQTAIRWTMQCEGITAPIVGARNIRQVNDNAGAVGWELSAKDMEYLDGYSREFAYSLPKYRTLFDKTIEA